MGFLLSRVFECAAMCAVGAVTVSPYGSGSVPAGTVPDEEPVDQFVNFETPHLHPIDLVPGGSALLAVNTADNRLETFSLVSGLPRPAGSVGVGLDPVSVRARSANSAIRSRPSLAITCCSWSKRMTKSH